MNIKNESDRGCIVFMHTLREINPLKRLHHSLVIVICKQCDMFVLLYMWNGDILMKLNPLAIDQTVISFTHWANVLTSELSPPPKERLRMGLKAASSLVQGPLTLFSLYHMLIWCFLWNMILSLCLTVLLWWRGSRVCPCIQTGRWL